MNEQEKYQTLWDGDDYRAFSPGEQAVELFVALAKPRPDDVIIDYGCGSGKAAAKIAQFARVKAVDFADNCLDSDVRGALGDRLEFIQHDLTVKPEFRGRFAFCTDVMEHIPTEDVDTVLRNIVHSVKHAFFQISNVPDHFGATIGEELHLTVKPFEWWRDKFVELGCNIHFARCAKLDDGTDFASLFFVTAYLSGSDIKKCSTVNTTDTVLIDQIYQNLQLGLEELRPYEQNSQELLILAGGPSLNDFVDEIRINKMMGLPIVTLNGAYNWALEHNIKPDVQVILDARDFNVRFTQPHVDSCKYLVASQCHPDLVRSLPPKQTFLWHSGQDNVQAAMKRMYKEENHDWFPVFGGMTVTLRVFPLLLMLGYNRFVVYGFDSCLGGNDHHAYPQPENDIESVIDVTCGGRQFKCHPWMLTQAQEWLQLQEMIGDLCQIDVKGDGLIAHTIRTGYEIAMEQMK